MRKVVISVIIQVLLGEVVYLKYLNHSSNHSVRKVVYGKLRWSIEVKTVVKGSSEFDFYEEDIETQN